MTNETKEPALLTTSEVCEGFRISRDTLQRWVRLGIAPRPVQLGPRCLRFRRTEIEAMEMRGGSLAAAERFGCGGRAAFWSPEIDKQPDDQRIEDISETSETTEQ